MVRQFLFSKKITKRGFPQRTLFPSTKIMKSFYDTVISIQYTNKIFFTTHILLFFNQNIIIINLKINKTQGHKCTSNHGGQFRTIITIYMRYRLITLHRNDIVNHSIPINARLCESFGSIMIKYAPTQPPTTVGANGKEIHGQKMAHTERWT